MADIMADCGRSDPHPPHTETGTMLGAYYSRNCRGLVVEPRPSYVLRLTGEQIGSITPPPDGDWFVDWDEHEDFVPLRMLDAAREQLANIEAEARQQERDRIAAAVEAMPGLAVGVSGVSVVDPGAPWVPASVVLAIVKGEQP